MGIAEALGEVILRLADRHPVLAFVLCVATPSAWIGVKAVNLVFVRAERRAAAPVERILRLERELREANLDLKDCHTQRQELERRLHQVANEIYQLQQANIRLTARVEGVERRA